MDNNSNKIDFFISRYYCVRRRSGVPEIFRFSRRIPGFNTVNENQIYYLTLLSVQSFFLEVRFSALHINVQMCNDDDCVIICLHSNTTKKETDLLRTTVGLLL